MALLSIPSITKGTPAAIALDKSALFALSAVAADDYFSDQANVSKCIIEYKSSTGNQKKKLIFNLSDSSPTANLSISNKGGKSSFDLVKIILEDFDGDVLVLSGNQIPSGFNIQIGGGGLTLDAYVSLLMRMEGSNGGSSFTDETGKTVTSVNAVTSTTNPKVGASAALFNGTNSSLSIPQSTDFDLGTGDFTIEGWFRWDGNLDGFAKINPVISYGDGPNYNTAADWYVIMATQHPAFGNKAFFQIGRYGNGLGDAAVNFLLPSGGANPTIGQWYHYAFVRESGVVKCFVDGVATVCADNQSATQATLSVSLNRVAASALYLGKVSAGGVAMNYMSGAIDELRVSKGIARYNSNFNPK